MRIGVLVSGSAGEGRQSAGNVRMWGGCCYHRDDNNDSKPKYLGYRQKGQDVG